MRSENVADFIGVNRLQSEFAKFVSQPFPPRAFAKRRRRDARQLHLPLRELRLLCAQPGKSRANFRKLTEVCYLVLHSRKWVGYVWLRSHGSRSLVVGPWSLAVSLRTTAFMYAIFSPPPCNSIGQRPRANDDFHFTTSCSETDPLRPAMSLVDAELRRRIGIGKFERHCPIFADIGHQRRPEACQARAYRDGGRWDKSLPPIPGSRDRAPDVVKRHNSRDRDTSACSELFRMS